MNVIMQQAQKEHPGFAEFAASDWASAGSV
jgi:hypothetical protein